MSNSESVDTIRSEAREGPPAYQLQEAVMVAMSHSGQPEETVEAVIRGRMVFAAFCGDEGAEDAVCAHCVQEARDAHPDLLPDEPGEIPWIDEAEFISRGIGVPARIVRGVICGDVLYEVEVGVTDHDDYERYRQWAAAEVAREDLDDRVLN